jgi:hypothetical protein
MVEKGGAETDALNALFTVFLFVPDNQRTDATDSIAWIVGVYEGKSNEHVQPADHDHGSKLPVAN